jgi:hypothetical protein
MILSSGLVGCGEVSDSFLADLCEGVYVEEGKSCLAAEASHQPAVIAVTP